MKIYLVRHGETYANKQKTIQGQSASLLTDKGRKQAELAGEYLRGIPFDMALASDLSRARETAKIIMKYHQDISIEFEKRLRERNFGIFEGGSPERYFDYIRKYFEKNPNATFFQVPTPKGETLTAAQKRILAFLEDTWQRYHKKTILMVTHGALLRLLIMYIKEMPEEMYYDENIKLENGSVTVLTYEGKRKITIEALNYIKHLDGLSLSDGL